jgi:hypothetical protein
MPSAYLLWNSCIYCGLFIYLLISESGPFYLPLYVQRAIVAPDHTQTDRQTHRHTPSVISQVPPTGWAICACTSISLLVQTVTVGKVYHDVCLWQSKQIQCQWLNALKKSRPETMSWVRNITFNIYDLTCDFAECGQIRLATEHFSCRESGSLPSRQRPAVMTQSLLILLFSAFPILVKDDTQQRVHYSSPFLTPSA